jgi:multiple sugar transport system ATP-binding protein
MIVRSVGVTRPARAERGSRIAAVLLDAVTVRFGDALVLDGVTLDVADGELMAVVGPSGSGKTSILRAIAGLDDLESGSVVIGDRDVTDAPTRQRDISMVFQDATLYPRMRARQNVGFPLSLRDVAKDEIRRRVDAEGRALEIEGILDRWPRQLSAGHRHLVQVAKAMVRVPSVFLLDEPLARVDMALRQKLRVELRYLQRGYGVTTVYVTNDSVEAMAMGDRVAVIRDGRVEQAGAPLDVYGRPASTFVASLLGERPMNLLSGRVEVGDGGSWISGEGFRLKAWAPGLAGRVGETVSVGVRPEDVEVNPAGGVEASVLRVVPLGSHVETEASVGPARMWIRTHGDQLRPSSPVRLRFSRWHVFGADGTAIAHID